MIHDTMDIDPQEIEDMIADVYYSHPAEEGRVICELILVNGFTVTGSAGSCPITGIPKDSVGEELARADATSKVWLILKNRKYDEKHRRNLELLANVGRHDR